MKLTMLCEVKMRLRTNLQYQVPGTYKYVPGTILLLPVTVATWYSYQVLASTYVDDLIILVHSKFRLQNEELSVVFYTIALVVAFVILSANQHINLISATLQRKKYLWLPFQSNCHATSLQYQKYVELYLLALLKVMCFYKTAAIPIFLTSL